MKHLTKVAGTLVCLCLLLFLANCQQDDNSSSAAPTPSGSGTSRMITLEELKMMPKAYAKFKAVSGDFSTARGIHYEDNEFSVNTQTILLYTDGTSESLTFEVFPDEDRGYTENLVLNKEADGEYNVYYTVYDFTQAEKEMAANNVYFKIDKACMYRVYGFDHKGLTARSGDGNMVTIDGKCYQRVTSAVRVDTFSDIPGQLEFSSWEEKEEMVQIACPEQPNYGGGGYIPIGIPTFHPVPIDIMPVPNPPAGTLPGEQLAPVKTRPVVNLLLAMLNNDLSQTEKQWLKPHFTMRNMINDMVSRGNYTDYTTRKDLVYKMIAFGMANVNNIPVIMNVLNYLEEKDYINDEIIPAKIAIEDIQNNIVQPCILNFIKKPCKKQIVNDLLQVSSPFLNTINQTFDTLETVNIRFSNKTDPNADFNATTDFPTQTEINSGNYTIDILFDDAYLISATDLSIVAVTLHEMVHAYLRNLYIKGLLVAENSNYQTLFNAYIQFYKNSSQVTFNTLDNLEHNAIVDFMQKMGNSIYNYAISKNIPNVTPDYCLKLAWGTNTGYSSFTTLLTPQQQQEYNNIYVYEQNGTNQAKGSVCNN